MREYVKDLKAAFEDHPKTKEKRLNEDLVWSCTQNATEEEFKSFLHLCTEYDLDPVKKEIWFIKPKPDSKPMIQTSRDGYLKIANRHEQFDGMSSDAVYEGDTLLKRHDESLEIVYGPSHLAFDKTKLMGAFCCVFRKDRAKAVAVFVSFKDYNKGTHIWIQYPNAMIIKVAESMAIKRAFSISGLVSQEEMNTKEE